MAGSAPLTFGQLSFWRVLQHRPESEHASSNLARIWPLPPHIPLTELRRRIAALPDRHESLRTLFRLTPEDPAQSPLASGEVRPTLESREGDWDEAAATRCCDALSEQPFDVTAGTGWRACVLTTQGRPRYLAMTSHHLTADAWGLAQLGAEVVDDSPAVPERLTPSGLAIAQRSPTWERRRADTAAHWESLFTSGFEFPYPPRSEDSGPARIAGVLRLGRRSDDVRQAATECRLTPHSVLLALTALGVALLSRVDAAALTLLSANRLEPRLQRLVTTMTQSIPCRLPLTMDEPFDEFARRGHRTAIETYRRACYDVDARNEIALICRGGPLNFDYYFNYAPTGRPPGNVDRITDPPQWEWMSAQRGGGPRFGLNVFGEKDITLHFVADPAYFPRRELNRFLTLLLALPRIIAKPDIPLSVLAAEFEGPEACTP